MKDSAKLYVIGAANVVRLRMVATRLYSGERMSTIEMMQMARLLDAVCDNAIQMPLGEEADRG